MTTLKVRIETLEETLARATGTWKSAEAGQEVVADESLAFASWDMMHRVLAPKRLEILRAMSGQGPISMREVARRVERDFKGVHADVELLLRNGVIDKTNGGIVFPYDRIHVEFDIEAAA
jgi:predicted transcriptional regulator